MNFGDFVDFCIFSCLKLGWILVENGGKFENNKINSNCRFHGELTKNLKENWWKWLFGFPKTLWNPKKPHKLPFESLYKCLWKWSKIVIFGILAFWACWDQKSNLSFNMWFFGIKSIKICSFDQKLYFGQ